MELKQRFAMSASAQMPAAVAFYSPVEAMQVEESAMSNVNGNIEEVVLSNGNGLHKVDSVEATDVPNRFSEKLGEYGDRIASGANQAKEKISELGERVAEKAESVKVQAAEFGNQAIEGAKYYGGEVGVQARTHPFVLLGVAVVAGALIARIGRG